MSEAPQPRAPRGVPEGGQFAASARGEANLSLEPLEGSLLYPPIFETADQIIEFWSHVEVPDEVLARAERLYVAYRGDIERYWPDSAWSYEVWEWNPDNPQPDGSDVGATADWEGRRRAAEADYKAKIKAALAERPEALDRRDVRPLVRAAAMFRSAASSLDLEGYKQVCSHEISFTTGRKSVRDAAFDSGIAGIASEYLDADKYDLDGVSKEDVQRIVREETMKQSQALDRALDEVVDVISGTSNAVIDAGMPGKRRGR